MRSRVSQLAGTDLNEVERATLAALTGYHRDLPTNRIASIPSGLGRRGESRIAGARHVRLWLDPADLRVAASHRLSEVHRLWR